MTTSTRQAETLTFQKKDGTPVEATIHASGLTMTTDQTGDAVFDLATPTSNNPALKGFFHSPIVPEMEEQLKASGVDCRKAICLYATVARKWYIIWRAEDIEAIIPYILAANAARRAAGEEARKIEERKVSIYLASRGWGDYSGVEWSGDITRPTAEILAACKAKLEAATDVDIMPTDAEIETMIRAARERWHAKRARQQAAAAHIEECKRRAKETGAKVEIRSYSTDCQDPDEECSLDIATEWAMPDGTIKTEYEHTW